MWGWGGGDRNVPTEAVIGRRQPATAAYRALAARYRAYRVAHGYSPACARADGLRVGRFLAWLEERGVYAAAAITPGDVAAYYGYLVTRPREGSGPQAGGALAASTARGHARAVRGACAMLHHARELPSDPASAVALDASGLAEPASPAPWTRSEVAALYAAVETELERVVLSLGYGCGLRVSEACALDVGDVRLGGRGSVTVRRGKYGRRRVVPLAAGVRDDLAAYYYGVRAGAVARSCSASAFVLNARGRRIRAETCNRVLRLLIARAVESGALPEAGERRGGMHGLRHAIATHLVESGVALDHVRAFLGHGSARTTEAYTHVTAEALARLVAP